MAYAQKHMSNSDPGIVDSELAAVVCSGLLKLNSYSAIVPECLFVVFPGYRESKAAAVHSRALRED